MTAARGPVPEPRAAAGTGSAPARARPWPGPGPGRGPRPPAAAVPAGPVGTVTRTARPRMICTSPARPGLCSAALHRSCDPTWPAHSPHGAGPRPRGGRRHKKKSITEIEAMFEVLVINGNWWAQGDGALSWYENQNFSCITHINSNAGLNGSRERCSVSTSPAHSNSVPFNPV
jgi:hypothetical protein